MVDDVRVVEEGAVDDETRGRYDPPTLVSLFLLRVVCCALAGWDGGRHERGDAKRG